MGDDRIAELEAQVARYERLHALYETLDERLEEAMRKRQPLERVMPALLRTLCDAVGATGAAVRTMDESLTERTFLYGEAEVEPDLLESSESTIDLDHSRVALRHELDVAGEPFGTAFCFFDDEPADDARALLRCFAELLDNHLAAIAQARSKYEHIRAISNALKEPVLERGISRAIDILRRQVDFADLVLMFRHEDTLESGAGVRYRIYKGGELLHHGGDVTDAELDAFLRGQSAAFLDGDDAAVRDRFDIRRYREEVLITGVRSARVIGRMLVTSRQGEFHTYDRELLDRFADYLRQRIVDFNREWKQLSVVFSAATCGRLLREEGYHERYLTPRDRTIAILYGDITGFTRISERVLRSPEAIGRLIDTWADRAVESLWRHHGAFDKMIGDCVIGLFGPPFFEDDAATCCQRALEAAIEIRALTRALTEDPDLHLDALDAPLDVSIGLSLCPVSVGFFGPNDDYTAFSSGMNNTARLQSIADGGQILCMGSFVEALGTPERFGPEERAEVKNVREPLVYRALLS